MTGEPIKGRKKIGGFAKDALAKKSSWLDSCIRLFGIPVPVSVDNSIYKDLSIVNIQKLTKKGFSREL